MAGAGKLATGRGPARGDPHGGVVSSGKEEWLGRGGAARFAPALGRPPSGLSGSWWRGG